MAMGKRWRRARQKTLWVASTDLPQSAGHPFDERLNRVLDDAGFDAFVEAQWFVDIGLRSYIAEPDRGRRNWQGRADAKAAVCANRRRIRGGRGRRLLRQRGERLERPNAHLYETGAFATGC
jgi:hypothetical protein